MAENSCSVHQSGERVAVSGSYEVVGVNLAAAHPKTESPVRTLHTGEAFPTYEGWHVCWRIRSGENSQQRPEVASE
jgi:hypothetical protein